jgi:hypothetical protein
MAVVGVFAAAFGLIRLTGSVLLVWAVVPAVALGLCGVFVTGGRLRRFFVGFTVGGVLAAAPLLAASSSFDRYVTGLTQSVADRAPDVIESQAIGYSTITYGPIASCMWLVGVALPALAASAAGGFLALVRWPSAVSHPVTREPKP